MFLKTTVLKKLLKEAYTGPGLHLSNDGFGTYIGSTWWGMWVKNGYITKKELGAIIELTGEMPEAGKGFNATREGNQYEIWEDEERNIMEHAVKCKMFLNVTDLCIRVPYGKAMIRVLQDPEGGTVMLMNEQIVNLIDIRAIGEQEDAPVGPAMINNESNVCWWSATMAFTAARYNPSGSKLQNLVDCLKQVDIREACRA